MKRLIEILSHSQYDANEATYDQKDSNWLLKAALMLFLLFLTMTYAHAQSGGWDGIITSGSAGQFDYGNGVIRLLSDNNAAGCQNAAVIETSPANQYNPTTANFSRCFQVFFGCPGADNIGPAGTDLNGDGMAFSFYKSTASYNNNGLSCGGGLGYMGAASDGKMISIEFDTWSSMGGSGFDANYGGGTSGNHDEFSLHRDGDASDVGLVNSSSADAYNLEDGLEHTVCISYNNTTHIFSATISNIAGAPGNVSSYSFDLTSSPYELGAYFGNVNLNTAWSSGKAGATNPATVTPSSAVGIVANLGGVPLCPAGVEITSPSDGQSFTGCPVAPITINATPTPPASTTTTDIEFFIDGSSVVVDNSAPYSYTWPAPSSGGHAITAVAHWSDGSSSNAIPVNINVSGIQKTSTAPTIDGTKEALWNSYGATSALKNNGATGADLSATWRMTYDASNLYVLVDVKDLNLINDSGNDWEDDGIEIYIDLGNDKSGSYGANDYQYVFSWTNNMAANTATSIAETKHGATASVISRQTSSATGYIMEIQIPWSSMGGASMPVPGSSMGFDLGVNDDDDGGTRDNQLSWNDASFLEFNNPSLFGTVQFTSCDPLPVSLLNFNGKLVGSTAVLNWSTAIEINNKKFVIERTSDYLNWEVIGEVAGAGNSSVTNYYTFRDYSPLQGVSYYRLRQVDFDGAFTNSKVVVIETGEHQIQVSISISPNPFDGDLTIMSNVIDENMDIIIYDVLGRILYQVNYKTDNGIVLIQPELPSGTYIITIQTDSLVQKSKIIKK
ncbi:MAG: T9SS type A sorting domain-containing protein [Cytophagaceae bacterium]|nr:T9SS type A sorting domain-containing protein [Cytophagaceae bacterium]